MAQHAGVTVTDGSAAHGHVIFQEDTGDVPMMVQPNYSISETVEVVHNGAPGYHQFKSNVAKPGKEGGKEQNMADRYHSMSGAQAAAMAMKQGQGGARPHQASS